MTPRPSEVLYLYHDTSTDGRRKVVSLTGTAARPSRRTFLRARKDFCDCQLGEHGSIAGTSLRVRYIALFAPDESDLFALHEKWRYLLISSGSGYPNTTLGRQIPNSVCLSRSRLTYRRAKGLQECSNTNPARS